MNVQPSVVHGGNEAQPTCWCCGNSYPESAVIRLGEHREVAVCFGCARFLYRQAQGRADALRGPNGPAVRARSLVRQGRATVLKRGWQDKPFVGPILRWIDNWLP